MLLPFAFVGLEGFRVLGCYFMDVCRRLGFEGSRVCLRVVGVPCVPIVFPHLNCEVRLVGTVGCPSTWQGAMLPSRRLAWRSLVCLGYGFKGAIGASDFEARGRGAGTQSQHAAQTQDDN